MCASKATGLDDISVKLLKITSDEIVDVLTFILIFSIETNCVEKCQGYSYFLSQEMIIL